jgi:hypothetical protein
LLTLQLAPTGWCGARAARVTVLTGPPAAGES